MKVLVVFYSRSGNTRKIAEALHRELGGELIEVHARRYPMGIRGYLRAGVDAAIGRAVPIRSKGATAQAYDLIVIGTPVWNASLSTPMRTFLAQSLPRARNTAFFLTYGGSGAKRVFGQMQGFVRKRPLATLAVRDQEINQRAHARKLKSFLSKIKTAAVSKAA